MVSRTMYFDIFPRSEFTSVRLPIQIEGIRKGVPPHSVVWGAEWQAPGAGVPGCLSGAGLPGCQVFGAGTLVCRCAGVPGAGVPVAGVPVAGVLGAECRAYTHSENAK